MGTVDADVRRVDGLVSESSRIIWSTPRPCCGTVRPRERNREMKRPFGCFASNESIHGLARGHLFTGRSPKLGSRGVVSATAVDRGRHRGGPSGLAEAVRNAVAT